MSAPLKIAVIGNIAAGKTTIADAIATRFGFGLATVVKEPVANWIECGILKSYYDAKELDDRDEVKALTQWTFQMLVLVSRLAEMKRARVQNPGSRVLIFDGHPMTDPAYTISYTTHPTANYRLWYERVHRDVLDAEDFRPDLLVYVATPPAKCLEQIKLRERSEESNVAMEYLQPLHEIFERIYEASRDCEKVAIYESGNMDCAAALSLIGDKISECEIRRSQARYTEPDEDSNL